MSSFPRALLLYNPNAGSGKCRNNLTRVIERYAEEGILLEPIPSVGDISIDACLADLAREGQADRYRQLIVAGGDGTINLCVNAMVKNKISLPLAIVPAGTANDFAYGLGIPEDINKAIEISLFGEPTPVDIGKANDRYFVNVSALGRVVDVSQKTDPALKESIGVLAYYLQGLKEVQDLRPIRTRLRTDDRVYEEEMYFMLVMNGKSAGGFKQIAPGSELNDGLLDIMLFRPVKVLELPQLFLSILKGTHPQSEDVLHFQTDHLIVETDEDLTTDIDGEKGDKPPVDFSLLHRRLKVLLANK